MDPERLMRIVSELNRVLKEREEAHHPKQA
jgi:hypothetical protein